MAHTITLKTFTDHRGSLTVVEKELPFTPRRFYYIYDVPPDKVRAGHRHHKNVQALICLRGGCEIYVNDGTTKRTYRLDSPSTCLILEPRDWHTMYGFTHDAILLVVASEPYDVADYIDEEYPS